ncbi:hypothetical protein HRbin09_00178 [bacterium HR09]|nr:hypothetical protein HRbin09_00178 [bacterium HR09]
MGKGPVGLALCWLACGLPAVFAQDPASPPLSVRLAGVPKADGSLEVTLYATAPGCRYLKVRSAPSGTPLLLLVDHGTHSLGQEERQAWTKAGGAVVATNLEETAPRVGGLERPASDSRVVVMAGCDGGELLLADAHVGSSGFSFSVNWREGRFTHCCENPPCGYRYVDCSGPAFTCCGPPCEISCGHVNCP